MAYPLQKDDFTLELLNLLSKIKFIQLDSQL